MEYLYTSIPEAFIMKTTDRVIKLTENRRMNTSYEKLKERQTIKLLKSLTPIPYSVYTLQPSQPSHQML